MTFHVHKTPAPKKELSLSGIWECITDPADLFEISNLPETGWKQTRVPSNWNTTTLDNYSGVVWYRTTFSLGEQNYQAARLKLSGVDYYADVWLNQNHLGHHEGYFQSFDYLAHKHLKAGANQLIVRVDSPWETPGIHGWPGRKRLIKGVLSHHDCRPGGSDPEKGQEENTGGIWNDVTLSLLGTCELDQPTINTTIQSDKAKIELNLRIQYHGNQAIEGMVHIQIENTDTHICEGLTLTPGANNFCTELILESPQLWSSWDQGKPNLYTLSIEVVTPDGNHDYRQETFGIRTIELDETKRCLLNGKPVFLRGTNVIPTLWLAHYSDEDIARDIKLLLDANINAVRVHGHIQRSEFYEACDQAGILVWCDFPLQWGYVNDQPFQDQALSQTEDWIQMLRNHPSIMAWCCHNEPTHTRETLSPLLAQRVRELDNSRPVIESSDFREHAYPGWYAGSIEDFTRLPGGPLMTEYGAQALPSEQALQAMFDEDERWPETPEHWKAWSYRNFQADQTFNVAGIEQGKNLREFVANSQAYQARLLQFATEHYRSNKWKGVTGIFQFMFMDAWPSISWSILDHARNPKAGYESLKKAFQPVLVTFKEGWHHRKRIEIGSHWSLATVLNLTVINDLPTPVHNANLYVGLALEDGAEFDLYSVLINIPADSVTRPFEATDILEGKFPYPELPVKILQKIQDWAMPGHYRLIARVYDENQTLISENESKVELVEPRILAATPFLSELSTSAATPQHSGNTP